MIQRADETTRLTDRVLILTCSRGKVHRENANCQYFEVTTVGTRVLFTAFTCCAGADLSHKWGMPASLSVDLPCRRRTANNPHWSLIRAANCMCLEDILGRNPVDRTSRSDRGPHSCGRNQGPCTSQRDKEEWCTPGARWRLAVRKASTGDRKGSPPCCCHQAPRGRFR
jgi:hypothetical protein